ncbi:MAG: hypothetical protein MI867_13810 [Pseudomonadales bacterium]|nr:hypothetical protein [Pseudomonadales bacterium]
MDVEVDRHDLSLIIVTCESYFDVVEELLKRLYEISFFDIGFDKIVVASDKCGSEQTFEELSGQNVHLVYAEGWGERVIKAANILSTSRCLLVLDDYLPGKNLQKHQIIDIADRFDESIDCVYLSAVFRGLADGGSVCPGYSKLPPSTLYRVNSTVGLWNVESLMAVLKEEDSPWAWEAFAGYRSEAKGMLFYAPINDEYQAYPYSYKTGGVVYRGGWVYEALREAGFEEDYISGLNKRPLLKDISTNKRSFLWKMEFLYAGYKMVKLKVLQFIYYSLKVKYSVK